MVAVRNGGSADPDKNMALFNTLKKARADGVPKANIETALAKASGGKDKGELLATYEAMAHGSVGVMMYASSPLLIPSHPSRSSSSPVFGRLWVIRGRAKMTAADAVKRMLDRQREPDDPQAARDSQQTQVRASLRLRADRLFFARFATVGFMFQRKGCVRVALDKDDGHEDRMEKLIEAAFETEAEDFDPLDVGDGTVELSFLGPPQALAKLTTAVMASGLARELLTSELIYAPSEAPEGVDEEMESRVGEMVNELEENEDTLRVWTTLDD
ncbi:hypothetical protein EW146_g6855 [Bondarzewia mesenterica]|uniref:YebC-like protein n=1 Tax=Bondarzewia mesenterica TaxID=1095465 RepID=A0A4S4LMD1_9AGAM|nr:hypothetical protein EW146_g6855 [Bondarzewia mesenterica]